MGPVFPSEIGHAIGQNPPFFGLKSKFTVVEKPMSCMDAMRHFQTQNFKLNEQENRVERTAGHPLERKPPLRASKYCATNNNDSHYYRRQGCIDRNRSVDYQESYSSPALWRWLGSLSLNTFAVLSLPCATGRLRDRISRRVEMSCFCQPPWVIFCGAT